MLEKVKLPPLLKGVLFAVLAVLVLLVLAVVYLSAKEYRPADREEVTVTEGGTPRTLAEGEELSILTFNIGYGALDAQHDFFMDGGKTVTTESADTIQRNMEGIAKGIAEAGADVVFLQEVDISSKRSYYIDETAYLQAALGTTSTFAPNFNAAYVPYPVPDTIGKVLSGLQTLSPFAASESYRQALPTSFKWPVRVCQLKRCLLVQRIPLANSDKELVLINLHLEAYDDGEGKILQTAVLTGLLQAEYEKGNYCIAGGDFNQLFPGVNPTLYPLHLTDAFMPGTLEESILPAGWQFLTDETTPTSRLLNEPYNPASENTQYYVIDGFICSPNVQVLSVETQDFGFAYSDHNPVLLQVRLGGEEPAV